MAKKPKINGTGARLPRLTRTHTHGPGGHKQSIQGARDERRILVRQQDASRLYVDQMLTYEEIGKRLGTSIKTAWYDVDAARARLYADATAETRAILQRQQALIDRLYKAHQRQATRKTSPSKSSSEVVLEVMGHEAKLRGLYPERKQGYSLDQVLSILRNYTGIVMDALRGIEDGRVPVPAARGLIAQGLREQMGPVGRQVTIDVEAVRAEPGEGDASVE